MATRSGVREDRETCAQVLDAGYRIILRVRDRDLRVPHNRGDGVRL